MSNERLSMKEINKYINSQLKSKYKTNENIHNVVCIENIIFNEKCHLVALFKDFLIYDDDYEFLKRFYNSKESNKKLILYFSYYEQYSISYPNYTILPESKYIYKNIHKKQRMLEKQQSMEKDESERKKSTKENKVNNIDNNNNKDIFNSNIYYSILKGSENDCNSIFGLSKRDNKEDADNISISLINDIINNIDNSEKENEQIKNNIKKKYENLIKKNNIINIQIRNYKFKVKYYTNTNSTTKNNTSISLNTIKSNTFKNNNSINENTSILYQGSNYIDKVLSNEKEANYAIIHKFKSNVINRMKFYNKKKKRPTEYPLNSACTNRNSIISFKKYFINKKNALSKKKNKNTEKSGINSKIKININNSTIINKKLDNSKFEKSKKSNKFKIEKNFNKNDIKKYRLENYNTFHISNNKKNLSKNIRINNFYHQNKKKILLDLKTCLSEKKLIKNCKQKQDNKKQQTRNYINNTSNISIKKFDNFIKNKMNYCTIESLDKDKLAKSICTSSAIAMKYNTSSNIKNKLGDRPCSSSIPKTNLINKSCIKNKIDISNSLSVKYRSKNQQNIIKNNNYIMKTYNTNVKNDKKIFNKKNLSLKKSIVSDSMKKKDKNNKKLLKKIIIRTKNKLAGNNFFSNLSINKSLNKAKNINTSKEKTNNNKLINKTIQNYDFKPVNNKFYLVENQLNSINGNLHKTKNLKMNQKLKNKLIKYSHTNSFKSGNQIKNKKIKNQENISENYNNINNNLTDSLEKIKCFENQKIKKLLLKSKNQCDKIKLNIKKRIDKAKNITYINSVLSNKEFTKEYNNSVIENFPNIDNKIFDKSLI